jgi:hypothetical protein
MPRPHYIIVSESGAEDTSTGLVSHYNVLESIRVQKHDAGMPRGAVSGQVQVPWMTFRATAVWMKREDEPDGEYEYEMRLYIPPSNKELLAQSGEFTFSPGKPFFRITLVAGGPPFEGSGTFRIESRVRLVGTDKWETQEYPIPVELVHIQATSGGLVGGSSASPSS